MVMKISGKFVESESLIFSFLFDRISIGFFSSPGISCVWIIVGEGREWVSCYKLSYMV